MMGMPAMESGREESGSASSAHPLHLYFLHPAHDEKRNFLMLLSIPSYSHQRLSKAALPLKSSETPFCFFVCRFSTLFLSFFFFFIYSLERETSICCSTYFCTHWWLLLVRALPGAQTHGLGEYSNQLSSQARA